MSFVIAAPELVAAAAGWHSAKVIENTAIGPQRHARPVVLDERPGDSLLDMGMGWVNVFAGFKKDGLLKYDCQR
jgi:hypothetical protein